MVCQERAEIISQERGAENSAKAARSDLRNLQDLVDVLAAHPNGLRRWSVMRAIRKKYEGAGRDVPQKFEDDIERTFRRFCADTEALKNPDDLGQSVLFYRPPERAGEVWGVLLERAKARLGVLSEI